MFCCSSLSFELIVIAVASNIVDSMVRELARTIHVVVGVLFVSILFGCLENGFSFRYEFAVQIWSMAYHTSGRENDTYSLPNRFLIHALFSFCHTVFLWLIFFYYNALYNADKCLGSGCLVYFNGINMRETTTLLLNLLYKFISSVCYRSRSYYHTERAFCIKYTEMDNKIYIHICRETPRPVHFHGGYILTGEW